MEIIIKDTAGDAIVEGCYESLCDAVVQNKFKLCNANLYGANLSGANLSGANLYGANLYGANLSGANVDSETLRQNPVAVSGLHWHVLITDNYMRIGCQRHTHEQWQNFTDAQIRGMDEHASVFWRVWKDPLLSLCAAHAQAVQA